MKADGLLRAAFKTYLIIKPLKTFLGFPSPLLMAVMLFKEICNALPN
jgi:hypothetical protein